MHWCLLRGLVETEDGKKRYLNEGDAIVEAVDTLHY